MISIAEVRHSRLCIDIRSTEPTINAPIQDAAIERALHSCGTVNAVFLNADVL